MKASAIAYANIALSKYWGKRDKKLMLPHNGSFSMTTSDFHAHTTVEFSDQYSEDILILNGDEYKAGSEEYDEYIQVFLNVVREMKPDAPHVKIVSNNNFPTAAGLASSAAGFAALAMSVNDALDLGLDDKGLTILARRGSGSATRSIHGGFVQWHRGVNDDGSDSYGEQVVDENYWPEFRMIACITDKTSKKVKSRAGMAQTVDTSPFYQAWLDTVEEDIEVIKNAVLAKDFTTLGSRAEHNALKMHSTALTTLPPIIYWNAGTLDIMHAVMDWRDEGLESYFTIDGGPQVKIMCLQKDVEEITKRAQGIEGIKEVVVSKPGPAARIVDDHLF